VETRHVTEKLLVVEVEAEVIAEVSIAVFEAVVL